MIALACGPAAAVTWHHTRDGSNPLPATPGGGGAFTSLERGPSGTILVGSDLCGIFRSSDDGGSWQCIGDQAGIHQTHIQAVSWDPRPGTTRALAAADAALGEPTHQSAIFLSTDDGLTWSVAYNSTGLYEARAYVTAFAWHGDTVVAIGTNGARGDSLRLWRSADAGATWALAEAPVGPPVGTRAIKLATRGGGVDRLWLLTGEDYTRPAAYAALYASDDGGATWTERAGPGAPAMLPTGPVLDFACDPARPETLLITVAQRPGDDSGRIFGSIDGGWTWNPRSREAGFTGCIAWLGSRIVVVNVARNLPGPAYGGVWESRDGEDDWVQRSSGAGWGVGWEPGLPDDLDWAYGRSQFGLANTLGRDLAGGNLYWITSRIVARSTDDGLTFEPIHTRRGPIAGYYSLGIENVVPFAGMVPDEDGDRLFAGYYDLGLWRSSRTDPARQGYWEMDNPVAWTGLHADQWRGHGGNCSVVLPDSTTPPYPPSKWVWAALGPTKGHQTFMRSPADGDPGTWQPVSGMPDAAFIHGLSVAPKLGTGDKTLYITADGDVYKSTDHGATWAAVSFGGGLRVTAVDHFDSSLAYAGGERGLFRSSDAGRTWHKIGLPEFEAPSFPADSSTVFRSQWSGIHCIAADPHRPGQVWVTSLGSEGGVWVGVDRGAAWRRLRGGGSYRSVAVSPVRPGWVWVTASRQTTGSRAIPSPPEPSVEHTEDGGASWIDDRANLTWPSAWQLYVDGRHRVYLGVPGMGYCWADFGGVETLAPPPCVAAARGPNPARDGTGLAGGRWYDVSGRAIPEPRRAGVYFHRDPADCWRRLVVLR